MANTTTASPPMSVPPQGQTYSAASSIASTDSYNVSAPSNYSDASSSIASDYSAQNNYSQPSSFAGQEASNAGYADSVSAPAYGGASQQQPMVQYVPPVVAAAVNTQVNPNDLYFHHSNFDGNKYVAKPPERRDNSAKKLSWWELPFGYQHAVGDTLVPGRFQFKLPSLNFTRGIVPVFSKDGTKIEYYKLNIPLHKNDPEHQRIMDMLMWLHQVGLMQVEAYATQLGRRGFTANNPMAVNQLQTPVFDPDDLPADKRQAGAGPSPDKYIRGKILNTSRERTIVRPDCDPNKVRDWSTLLNKPFTGSVIINVSHIYIPGNGTDTMTFQIKVGCIFVEKTGVSVVSADFGKGEIRVTDEERSRQILEDLDKPAEPPAANAKPAAAPGLAQNGSAGAFPGANNAGYGSRYNTPSANNYPPPNAGFNMKPAAPTLAGINGALDKLNISNMPKPGPAPGPKLPVFPALKPAQ